MDFTTKQWLVGVIVVVILAILIDGFRRMKRARHDSLHMSLNPKATSSVPGGKKDRYGSEFPNGGARPSERSIDKSRIDEVKSQYDFGRDISEILKRDNAKKTEKQLESEDQWVDEDEGDEEYYARKWDDEYEEETDAEPALDDQNVEIPLDNEVYEEPASVVNEGDGDHKHDEVIADTVTRSPEKKEVYLEPEQVSLNLEESLPVLMETVEDDDTPADAIVEDDEIETEANDIDQSAYDDLGDEDITIRPVGKHIKPAVEPSIDEEESLDTRSANKPRYRSKYFSSEVQEEAPSSLSEVLVINVKSTQNRMMQGGDLLAVVLENGLRYGEMDIFHYHADEDGEGPVLFSMASMLKPGTFDLKTIDSFSTVGITLFLTLPVFDNKNMAAFEIMLSTAKNIAAALGAELNDDQRSIMTAQTMEHYRERIRDFARRQQLEKNK
jgi:cell division protein ZipA